MEVLVLPTPADVARRAADGRHRRARRCPPRRAGASDSPPGRRRSGSTPSWPRPCAAGRLDLRPCPRASRSTSTSACPRGTRSRTARCCCARSAGRWGCRPTGCTCRTAPAATRTSSSPVQRSTSDSSPTAGGVDVQILGIGANGHLGFNEPGSALSSRTRVKRLSDRTRHDNARFFDGIDDVPTHCVTQGLGTVLDARRLVLVASGPGKAAAVAAALEGPLSASCPASVLQWHADATVVLDEAAAVGPAQPGLLRRLGRGPVSATRGTASGTPYVPRSGVSRTALWTTHRGEELLLHTPWTGVCAGQRARDACDRRHMPTVVHTPCPHLLTACRARPSTGCPQAVRRGGLLRLVPGRAAPLRWGGCSSGGWSGRLVVVPPVSTVRPRCLLVWTRLHRCHSSLRGRGARVAR